MTHTQHPIRRRVWLLLPDENATDRLGDAIAQAIVRLHGGLVIELIGPLGSGKTTLARAVLKSLGVEGAIHSPSYSLVEEYEIELPASLEFRQSLSLYCYHFDFYRFAAPGEWEDAGFRDYFGGDALCLVEWPERSGVRLPAPDLRIFISGTEQARTVDMEAYSARGETCLAAADSLGNR